MSDIELSTSASTATCPLLKFPPEIRNRIWTLVVTVGIVCIKWDCPKPSGKHFYPTTMALAFTCRQIYREATPIYYSKNTFRFPQYSPIELPRRFAAAIGPANAESITAVEILFTFQAMLMLQERLKMATFPNLKALWSYHNVAPYCYGRPTTQPTLPAWSNLLETQTGKLDKGAIQPKLRARS